MEGSTYSLSAPVNPLYTYLIVLKNVFIQMMMIYIYILRWRSSLYMSMSIYIVVIVVYTIYSSIYIIYTC